MSDDFNIDKIHLMMTLEDMARNFRVGIEHQDSLFVLGNSRLKSSFDLAIVYKIALSATDFVHYSKRLTVGFILLLWSILKLMKTRELAEMSCYHQEL